MSNHLPPPVDLTQPPPARPEPDQHYTSKEDKPKYNLDAMHESFKAAKEKLDHIACTKPVSDWPAGFINPTTLLYELIDRDIWRPNGSRVIRKHIGYSEKYQSLTVSLFDGDKVAAICIRNAIDRDGNPVKWKTYGSKRLIPHRIFDADDPTIFVGYGIGEFLLFELLELNYMVLQSDSIAHTLFNNPYAPHVEDRYIFALLDNDTSCKATVEQLQRHYRSCKAYGIDFEHVLDKELPKGYDFRDFCNEIAKEVRGKNYLADPQLVKNTIVDYLANEIKLLIGGKR